MRPWNKIRLVKIFLQLVINPKRTDLIFQGVDIVSKDPNQEPVRDIENLVLGHPNFKSMYEQRYRPTAPSLSDLNKLPLDSFGFAVFQHMKKNNLGFEIFPQPTSDRPINYLSARIYQDHDLWHVLLDYDIELEDELALQAFGVAQFESLIGMLLIAGGFLHLIGKNPRRAISAFQKVVEGYILGKQIPFLLGARLHDEFAKPLAEVREKHLKTLPGSSVSFCRATGYRVKFTPAPHSVH